MKKGSETTQTPHSPHKYVERLFIYKEKCRYFAVSTLNLEFGDEYGIRTRECMRERHVS